MLNNKKCLFLCSGFIGDNFAITLPALISIKQKYPDAKIDLLHYHIVNPHDIHDVNTVHETFSILNKNIIHSKIYFFSTETPYEKFEETFKDYDVIFFGFHFKYDTHNWNYVNIRNMFEKLYNDFKEKIKFIGACGVYQYKSTSVFERIIEDFNNYGLELDKKFRVLPKYFTFKTNRLDAILKLKNIDKNNFFIFTGNFKENSAKIYSLKKWKELFNLIKESKINFNPIYINNNEQKFNEELNKIIPGTILPKLSISEMLYLMANNGNYLGIDSGPMHMAALIGLQCFGIFSSCTKPINLWRTFNEKNKCYVVEMNCSHCILKGDMMKHRCINVDKLNYVPCVDANSHVIIFRDILENASKH